ncbi:MAG: alpha/beta fold hydrolase [Psychrobium sp.]
MKKTLCSLALITASFLSHNQAAATTNQCLNAKVSGQGQAVLLLPGFVSDETVWDEISANLANDYQVHQLSIAGFGKNPACKHASDIASTIKGELANYLNSNKLAEPILVGHSMGGLLAFDASLNPNIKLKAAISVDGLPFIGPIFTRSNQTTAQDLAPQATAIKAMYQNATPEQMVAFTQQGIALQTNNKARYKDILAMAKQSDPHTAGSALSWVMTTDLRPKLANATNPVLLIGASGAFKTEQQHQAAQAMYQAQLTDAPKVSLIMNKQGHHFLMWDQKDWLLTTIKHFIKQQPNS